MGIQKSRIFQIVRVAVFSCLSVTGALEAQQTTQSPSPSAAQAASIYVQPGRVPAPVRQYLTAFGNRLQNPGNERTVLTGTYTGKNGQGTALLTWQAPGSLRFDRSDQSSKPLIYATGAGLVNASNLSADDASILESLLDDAAENFLYSFQQTAAHRLLGIGFRTDNGKASDYQGPYYDIYETVATVKARPNTASGVKRYYFNTQTGILAKTQYTEGGVSVVTEFNNWTTSGGQSYPGQIVRQENGTTVFTFTIGAAGASAGVQDGTFD